MYYTRKQYLKDKYKEHLQKHNVYYSILDEMEEIIYSTETPKRDFLEDTYNSDFTVMIDKNREQMEIISTELEQLYTNELEFLLSGYCPKYKIINGIFRKYIGRINLGFAGERMVLTLQQTTDSVLNEAHKLAVMSEADISFIISGYGFQEITYHKTHYQYLGMKFNNILEIREYLLTR